MRDRKMTTPLVGINVEDIVVKYYECGTLPDLRSNVEEAVDIFLYAEQNGHTRLQAAIATQFAALTREISEAENTMVFLTAQKELLETFKFNEFHQILLDSIPKFCFWQGRDVFKSVKLPCCGMNLCEMCWEGKSLFVNIKKWKCDCGQIFIGPTLLRTSKPDMDKLINIQCYNRYEELWNCVALECFGGEKLLNTKAARELAKKLKFDYKNWIYYSDPFRI